MAEIRMIHTMLWQDEFFKQLSAEEQVVYLYLLTTPNITYYGTLKMVPEMMAAEMGRPVEQVRTALDRFERDGKVTRHDPYWLVVNFYAEHQARHKDGRGAAELPKRSREALLANRYEMPEAVWQRVLDNWEVASSDLVDSLSDRVLDTLSDRGLAKREGRREKRKEERGKGEKPDPPPLEEDSQASCLKKYSSSPITSLLAHAWARRVEPDFDKDDKNEQRRLGVIARRIARIAGDDDARAKGVIVHVIKAAQDYQEVRLGGKQVRLYNLAPKDGSGDFWAWYKDEYDGETKDSLTLKALGKRMFDRPGREASEPSVRQDADDSRVDDSEVDEEERPGSSRRKRNYADNSRTDDE